jgi:hypothetical protein
MKITNVSTIRIYLHDLRFIAQAQTEGRQGEDRYLNPGQSVYLPNTTEVIRSAFKGDLRKWRDNGIITLEDNVTLAGGANVVLNHNFGLPPDVSVVKAVGPTWVDATGTFNAVHNAAFTTTTITNTTGGALTFLIRLG